MDLALEFLLNRSDGDAEDALASLEYIDDLIGAVSGKDRCPVGEQGDVVQRIVACQLIPQDFHGAANLLQAHSGVEESLEVIGLLKIHSDETILLCPQRHGGGNEEE